MLFRGEGAGVRRAGGAVTVALALLAAVVAGAEDGRTAQAVKSPTPSCADGMRNQDETEIDCGGSTACPRCALNQSCKRDSDCLSGKCTGGRCKCGKREFTFTVFSNEGGFGDSAEWPGGTQSQTSSPGCSVTVNNPNDNVDLICKLAVPFSINSYAGFSSCAGSGGEDGDGCKPLECPPAGIGMCCSGRPSCSSALNGRATAEYRVTCSE